MKKSILITIVVVVALGIFIADRIGWEEINCNDIDASDMSYYAGRCVDGGGKSFNNLIGNFLLAEFILILIAVVVYQGIAGLAAMVKGRARKSKERGR